MTKEAISGRAMMTHGAGPRCLLTALRLLRLLAPMQILGLAIGLSLANLLGAFTAQAQPFSCPVSNGSCITAPTNQTLTDANGHVFTFGGLGLSQYGYVILRDGIPYINGQAIILILNSGVVWAYNAGSNWYSDTGTSWAFQGSGPVLAQTPTCTPSSNGSSITAPTSQSLTDQNCHVFTFAGAGASQYGYIIMRDGTSYFGGLAVKLTINNGVVWAYNAAGNWYSDTGASWAFKTTTGPGLAQTPPCTPSSNGATIAAPSSQSLTDQNCHVFTFAGLGSSRYGYTIMRDGTSYFGGFAVKLTINNGAVWAYNAAGNWYSDTGASWVFQAAGPPGLAQTPPCTPSSNGATIAAPSSQSLTDQNCHVFTFAGLGSSRYGYIIMRDGAPYSGGLAVKLMINNGIVWAYNAAGNWYSDTGASWTFQTAGLPTPTSPTSPTPPTPPATTPTTPSTTIQANCVDFSVPPPTPSLAANAIGDEFVGPFASWTNLKTTYNAKGDGVTDDTVAIQTALSALSTAANKSPVLFIPAGTYLVKQTVTVQVAQNISIIGEDPNTTTLKWGGQGGGTLLHINAVAYSRFNRITFDGSGTAGVLVDQSFVPNTQGGYFDTGNEYADDVFKNAQIGIQGGQYGIGAAESSVLRSKFIGLNTGIQLKNFNALDWWVWYSDFENNVRGISNNPGAGNFHVYNSVFNGSSMADIDILNTGTFNFRDNFSVNSKQFLVEEYYYENAAVTRLQGNTVIVPSGAPYSTIYQGNMGPIVLTDNVFVQNQPPVVINSLNPPDCVSIGNTYTVSNPVTCQSSNGAGRYVTLDDKIVPAASINWSIPTLPGVLPNYNRMVFEVPAGSNSSGIQNAINQAASYCGQRPVVHLPYGSYALNQTVTIPANCNIQLVGDGEQTALYWGGAGPALLLQGPSRAILRDFYLGAGNGNGTGILVQNADQAGSRIYMQQATGSRSLTANIFVDSLDYTLVELQNFQLVYTMVAPASTGVGLKVVGGPLAQQGTPKYGRTNLFAGSSGGNYLTYQASQGASLLVRDAWYESNTASTFAQVSDNSSVTFEGSRIANVGAGSTPVDAVQFNNFSCNAAVLSSSPDSDVKISGNGEQVWVVGNNFAFASNYFTNLGGPSSGSFNLNRRYNAGGGSLSVSDLTSVPNANFIRQTLAQSRAAHPSQIMDLVAGVTDVRLYRVGVELGNIGFHFQR